jgi:16S rRNA (uracil1498-N3)-methyltransferase
MPRFFVNKEDVTSTSIVIKGEDAKHVSVLRHKINDIIEICDKDGMDYKVCIEDIQKDEIKTTIVDKYPTLSEPKTKVTLFQSLPKNDKMELIIQKCVELGIYEIIPVVTENTIAKLNDKANKKIQRWQKISETASKQCGRGIIPNIAECITFKEAINLMNKMDESFVAYEKENDNTMKKAFETKAHNNVGLFIGAEGGFTKEEIEICKNNNIHSISLGKRILRTETAGFTALTIMLFMKNEL